MNKKVLAGIGLGAILLIVVSLVYLFKGPKKVVSPESPEVATVPPPSADQLPAITGKLGGSTPETPTAPPGGEPPGVKEKTPPAPQPVLPTPPEPSVTAKPVPAVPLPPVTAPPPPVVPEPVVTAKPVPAVPEPAAPVKMEEPKPEAKEKAKAKAEGPSAEKKEYGILVAKFRNYKSAKELSAKLQRQGKKGYVRRSPQNKYVYEVWVAPLATPAQAKAMAKSLKVKYKLSPTVKQVKRLPPK